MASNPSSPRSCRWKTNAEVNRLDVTNTTDAPVVLDVTGSVEWCLWNAVDDSSNFQRNLSTGEVEIEKQDDATLIYHKTEFKERRNHYAFFAVNSPVVGFDTSRDEFLGKFNGWGHPQVITEGQAHDSVGPTAGSRSPPTAYASSSAGRDQVARIRAWLHRSRQGGQVGGSERSGQGRHHQQEAGA